jgi:hypothetical protein
MWKSILEKVFSARFLMTIFFTFTYCLIEMGCVYLAFKKIMSIEVFIAQLATFTVIVREIAEWYFKRDDRAKEGDRNGKSV